MINSKQEKLNEAIMLLNKSLQVCSDPLDLIEVIFMANTFIGDQRSEYER